MTGVDREPSRGVEPDGEPVEGWPVELAGVVEAVAATRGPNGRWNHAALGIEPANGAEKPTNGDDPATDGGEPTTEGDEPARDGPDGRDDPGARRATARTWGRTRTRRNLAERDEAYVQFVRDPVDFVAAALAVHETDAPVLERADAWVRVAAEERDRGEDAGTEWIEWTLTPTDAAVRRRAVPTTNRGRAAVVEATVAASRLDVEPYDESELLERLAHLEAIVERCGSERDRTAFERIDELSGWRARGGAD